MTCFAAWTKWKKKIYWKRQAEIRYREYLAEKEYMRALNEALDQCDWRRYICGRFKPG